MKAVDFFAVWVALVLILLITVLQGEKIRELQDKVNNSYAPIITDKSICEFDSDYIPDTGMGVINP